MPAPGVHKLAPNTPRNASYLLRPDVRYGVAGELDGMLKMPPLIMWVIERKAPFWL
jgi:hypothetical protein